MVMPTAVATTITIVSDYIDNGAYQIKVVGAVPPGGAVFLCLESAQNRVDITGGYDRAKLPALLKAIAALGKWGTTIRAWAVIEQNGKFVCESPAQNLLCPVKPFDGPLTFDGMKAANPWLTFAGDGYGRLLTDAIDGKYYFRHGFLTQGGTLETKAVRRGFDCTTFPMALFQKNINMIGKDGTPLAVALGAQPCDMELKYESQLKKFFADSENANGLYFMWSEGHVVLVKNAFIHEFTNRLDPPGGGMELYGGYRRCPAATWPGYHRAARGQWWVRKLPATLNP